MVAQNDGHFGFLLRRGTTKTIVCLEMAVERIEPIRLAATVVQGFGRGGKQLGCPTANLCREDLGKKLDELSTGIYCGWATVGDQGPFKAVASIGWNPYFKNKVRIVRGLSVCISAL